MRLVVLGLVFLLVVPLTFADISISWGSDSYNIGDEFWSSASLQTATDVSGFVRFTLVCDSFSQLYYLQPVELQGGFRSEIEAYALKITGAMKGQCHIDVDLLDEQNNVIETNTSSSFSVSDGLSIHLTDNITDVLPGGSQEIEGLVRSLSGEGVNAHVELDFDGESYGIDTTNGHFSFTFLVPSHITSGAHPLEIEAKDDKGNKGKLTRDLVVTAVADRMSLELEHSTVLPGNVLTYTIRLDDQAGNPVERLVDVSLQNPDDQFLFNKELLSEEVQEYSFGQYSESGTYTLTTYYKELEAEASVVVSAVEELDISQVGTVVIVQNVGNIDYNDKTTFILEGDDSTYAVTKKIKLKPGERTEIELSTEVPPGEYAVLTPTEVIEDGTAVIKQEVLAAPVVVEEDNRPVTKKAGSAIDWVTGHIVGSDGIVSDRGWLAQLFLIALITLIVVHVLRRKRK